MPGSAVIHGSATPKATIFNTFNYPSSPEGLVDMRRCWATGESEAAEAAHAEPDPTPANRRAGLNTRDAV